MLPAVVRSSYATASTNSPVLMAVLLLIVPMLGMLAPRPTLAPPDSTREGVASGPIMVLVAAAESLTNGDGPANGQPWACGGVGSGHLACFPAHLATPTVSVASGWTNLTTSVAPPRKSWASMAFDAADGYVVLFGGFSPTAEPTSGTWIFADGRWLNITSSAGTPPAPRYGMGMTYDGMEGYV